MSGEELDDERHGLVGLLARRRLRGDGGGGGLGDEVDREAGAVRGGRVDVGFEEGEEVGFGEREDGVSVVFVWDSVSAFPLRRGWREESSRDNGFCLLCSKS